MQKQSTTTGDFGQLENEAIVHVRKIINSFAPNNKYIRRNNNERIFKNIIRPMLLYVAQPIQGTSKTIGMLTDIT